MVDNEKINILIEHSLSRIYMETSEDVLNGLDSQKRIADNDQMEFLMLENYQKYFRLQIEQSVEVFPNVIVPSDMRYELFRQFFFFASIYFISNV